MKIAALSRIFFFIAGLSLWVCAGTLSASPSTTQVLDLHPGWNSIFLDVQPPVHSPEIVFAALPEDSSVWHYSQRISRVEYIKNPDEGLWNQPGWNVYYKSQEKGFLSNLYAILPDRAYLVFVAGQEEVSIPVTGVPSVKEIRWAADSFNLMGFSVAEASNTPVSFARYFSGSPAHTGQAVYTLDTGGQWKMIDNNTAIIQPGRAYWVYCQGSSKFQGNLNITLPVAGGLNFVKGNSTQEIILHNISAISRDISFQNFSSDVFLTYQYYDEASEGFLYPPLSTMPVLSLGAGEKITVTLNVRREKMAGGEAGSVLTIKDNGGTTVHVPVWVDRESITASAKRSSRKSVVAKESAGVLLPGLWVGTARLDKVSQARQRGPDFYFDLQVIGRKDGEVLVSDIDPWKVLTGTAQPGDWYDAAFDDSVWSDTGSTPYDTSVTGTSYFRKAFTVDAVSMRNYSELVFTLKVDDGAAIYLNGKLIRLYNIIVLDHPVPSSTEVSGEAADVTFSVPGSLLLEGVNQLAVQVHQYTTEVDDLVFSLEMKAASTDVLVPFADSGWAYSDSGVLPPDDASPLPWNDKEYSNDSEWKTLPAPFEYALNDTSYNPHDLNPDADTIYFRKIFSVNPGDYDYLAARLLYDDGAVFYSNGVEDFASHRLNMPDEGSIEYSTSPLAIRRASERSTYTEIPLSNLVNGNNVLAVEVHQHPTEVGGVTTGNAVPVAASAALNLRLLLHVDAEQKIRLLKEVIMMSDRSDPANSKQVLLTDHGKIPDYNGVIWRDGVQVSRRISSSGFDFTDMDSAHPGTMQMAQNGDILSCELSLPGDHPGNPFLHRYHPDHDNLNARYDAFAKIVGDEEPEIIRAISEVPEIIRAITIEFKTVWDGEADSKPPGWGEDILEGLYSEVISGLHTRPITINGDFTLQHVSDVEILNP